MNPSCLSSVTLEDRGLPQVLCHACYSHANTLYGQSWLSEVSVNISPLTSSVWLWEIGNTELKITLLLCHCWPGWIYNGKSQTIFFLQQMPMGSLQMSWLLAQTVSAWSCLLQLVISDTTDLSGFGTDPRAT